MYFDCLNITSISIYKKKSSKVNLNAVKTYSFITNGFFFLLITGNDKFYVHHGNLYLDIFIVSFISAQCHDGTKGEGGIFIKCTIITGFLLKT